MDTNLSLSDKFTVLFREGFLLGNDRNNEVRILDRWRIRNSIKQKTIKTLKMNSNKNKEMMNNE